MKSVWRILCLAPTPPSFELPFDPADLGAGINHLRRVGRFNDGRELGRTAFTLALRAMSEQSLSAAGDVSQQLRTQAEQAFDTPYGEEDELALQVLLGALDVVDNSKMVVIDPARLNEPPRETP